MDNKIFYYLETKEAAQAFNVSSATLRSAVARNSNKYEWLKVDNANGGRGGKKLLFKVSKDELLTAFNQELISKNTLIFNEKMQEVKLSEIITIDNLKTTNNSLKTSNLNLTEPKIDNDLAVLNLKFENLSDELKEDARSKVKLLKQVEKYIEGGLKQKRALEILNIKKDVFMKWQQSFKAYGILGLIDTRGLHRKDKTKLSTWMQEHALREYRTFGAGGFNFTELWWQIHKEAAIKENYDFIGFDLGKVKPLFSVKTLQNFIKNYYKDKPLEHCIITQGLDRAKSKFLPAQGNQRELYDMKNMCWQIDSSPADIIVRDDETLEPFRPHILSVVDVFSGMGVATLVGKSNSLSLTRLLWKAIEKFGKPDMIKGDNGKDYLSKDFQSLLDALNISYDAAIAYAGEQKALGFGDEELSVNQSQQSKEKTIITNAYSDELPQSKENLGVKSDNQAPLNNSSSFNNGNINVSVNGTFNIATENGNFNMQEFAVAIQKSVFDALRKQEQNKINTTIYG